MKRGKPLKRKTELKRGEFKRPTVEQVRAWQSKPRKAIAKVGRKGRRERADRERFAREVRAHAAGWCEAAGIVAEIPGGTISAYFVAPICGTARSHRGSHPHHVWPEDRDAGRHDSRRGLWVCAVAHRWIHDHPAEAAKLGLLRPESGTIVGHDQLEADTAR